MKGARAIFFVLALLLAPVDSASSCTCSVPSDDPDSWIHSEAVFVGTVVSVQEWSYPDLQRTTDNMGHTLEQTFEIPMHWFVFEVERAWRGVHTKRVALHSGATASACGVGFQLGERVLVLADRSAPLSYEGAKDLSGLLAVSSCSGSRPHERNDVEALDRLAQPLLLEPIAPDDPRLFPPSFVKAEHEHHHVHIVLLLLTLVALVGLMLRICRRRSS